MSIAFLCKAVIKVMSAKKNHQKGKKVVQLFG